MGKLKTLIAEDNLLIQNLFRVGLPGAVFDLQFAGDGEQALSIYRKWQPEIVLLDIQMPTINGFQVLNEIRATIKDVKTSIIMVTSMSDKEDIMACAKLGIQGYIIKPFVSRKIAATVLKYHKENHAA